MIDTYHCGCGGMGWDSKGEGRYCKTEDYRQLELELAAANERIAELQKQVEELSKTCNELELGLNQ